MATANTDVVQESDGSFSKQIRIVGTGGSSASSAPTTQTNVTATSTTGQALAANTSRKCAFIQNDDVVDAYAKIGASAVANQGFRIPANGGGLTISLALGNLSTGAINVITASGTARLLVSEWS